ncbi:single-stranded-DNA-specific exonuclease RecJ [Flavobacterium agrisoli]|uniref:Single-stranded-DNA-specific exonuclease RecJ n=1 Tax=Flavobacterium agrisoli TaxID=2793066 RepID=A0A934PPN5_9FLAO|nr:single-stranded-DNA-specific exonuclease RecJ [Flavobacterium agrisoli]MBK0371050.1 single-stranded-DNA-specific exonuclease RecJ [Flavobacterium agrisoli]
MRWTLKPKPSADKVKQLAQDLNVEELVATLLVQRGIETFEQAKDFFRPSLTKLHDPYLMKDMDKAVNRIEKAIQNQENILVFGDYDVDGTTAVSLVASYLRSYYPNVATYIPDRYNEGYGVSFQGIDFADDNQFSLIIALDCGIKSVEHVAYAKSKNIDFIICDHHLPGPILPDAVAVLDPKRADCLYPYKELCGCGVGFKLIQALGGNRGETTEDLMSYLDLVATAIAADIVPITGENRILAYYGIEVINSNPRNGIKVLLQNLKKAHYDISDLVFVVAPRINAAGRIKHGEEAVKLLTEFDFEQAEKFAKEINDFNTERKGLDKQITQDALLQISHNQEEHHRTTVVFDEKWHKGVIGIVASRLIETYYRPTLVFTQSGDKYAASARSVKGFDVYNALEACSEHLEQFGGHKYAAGMTIKPEKYADFKTAFEEEVTRTISPEMLEPELEIDAEIDFEALTPKLIRILKQFEPFGPQNMHPVFKTTGVADTGHAKLLGSGEEHLRLFLKQNVYDNGVAAVGFGLGKKWKNTPAPKKLEIAYTLGENEWNGTVTTQLYLKDFNEI